MKLEPLTKPRKGYSFWVGKLLIHFNFARTWWWSEDNYNRTRRNTYLLTIHVAQRPQIKDRKIVSLSALSVIVGPVKIMFGLVI